MMVRIPVSQKRGGDGQTRGTLPFGRQFAFLN
jgi:hypothetical protein